MYGGGCEETKCVFHECDLCVCVCVLSFSFQAPPYPMVTVLTPTSLAPVDGKKIRRKFWFCFYMGFLSSGTVGATNSR